jgi:hypothetical protein
LYRFSTSVFGLELDGISRSMIDGLMVGGNVDVLCTTGSEEKKEACHETEKDGCRKEGISLEECRDSVQIKSPPIREKSRK